MTATAAPWPPAFAGTPAVAVIERALEAGRLSHSLLLAGDDPEGLAAVGQALAERILHRGGGQPYPAAHHPDCHQIRPAGKARVIKAEMIRDLIQRLNVSASVSRAKVAVLHDAERMNPQAANIFLKTLEEPPPGTTLLLLTGRPYSLLPTIRSRVLHFRFPGLTAPVRAEGWESWVADYGRWLGSLGPGVTAGAGVAASMFGLYGLVSRFGNILEQAVAAEFVRRKESLPEDLGDDEVEAIEAEVAVGIRQRMFAAIEAATRRHANQRLQAGEAAAGRLLAAATDAMEHVAGLLKVNLNVQAALEDFLLASLRIWSRR